MTNGPSDLTAHLGFWLRTVSNGVSGAFAAKLAGKEVTVAEWVVMRILLSRGAVAPSRLADETGMTRGAITKLADRLIARGLIAREADPDDGRAQTLVLTPRGQDLTPELAVLADQNDAEFFSGLSAGERDLLQNLLKRLAAQARLTTPPID